MQDRLDHDLRYAIDPAKIHAELGWLPRTNLAEGLDKTIRWYLDNREWWEHVTSGAHQDYYRQRYCA